MDTCIDFVPFLPLPLRPKRLTSALQGRFTEPTERVASLPLHRIFARR